MSFDPDAPCVLGLEWKPRHTGVILMDTALAPGALKLESSATETINAIWYYAAAAIGDVPETYQVEVYEDGVFPDSVLTTTTAYPTSDAFNYNTLGFGTFDLGGTSTDVYRFVDNVTQSPVVGASRTYDDDFLWSQAGARYQVSFHYDGVGAFLSGKLITNVSVVARIQPYSPAGPTSMTIIPFLMINGTSYYGPTITKAGENPGGHLIRGDFPVNPAAHAGWTPDDITDFEDGGNTSAGFLVYPTGSGSLFATILQCHLEVQDSGTDVRLAVGDISLPDFGWFRVPIAQPDGTPGWSKVSGTDYRITLTRKTVTSGGRYIGLKYLWGDEDESVNRYSVLQMRNTSEGVPFATDPGAPLAVGIGILLEKTAGTDLSKDSQPYITIDEARYVSIDSANTLFQLFTTPASLPTPAFGLARILVQQEAATVDGSLILSVHRVSDDLQFGSSITITTAMLDEIAGGNPKARYSGWHDLQALFGTAPTLATSTQYYVKMQTSASAGTGWKVQVASVQDASTLGAPPLGAVQVGIGGLIDYAIFNTNGSHARDVVVSIATLPVPPANFAGVETSGDTDCISGVHLSWNTSGISDCGGLGYYEVQRSDDLGVTWKTIFHIEDVSTLSVDDWESQRNREAYYRMRLVRGDGAISAWSPTKIVTAHSVCCGYGLFSNEAPELNVWVDDISSDGSRSTNYPQNVEIKQFIGRNFNVGFHELEDRGARFKRTFLVAANSATDGTPVVTIGGEDEFNPIFAIARPSQGGALSYVCVHSDAGDRWFATLLTPATKVQKLPGYYTAEVEIIEVTDTPSSPDPSEA